jgi:hypothetical protein
LALAAVTLMCMACSWRAKRALVVGFGGALEPDDAGRFQRRTKGFNAGGDARRAIVNCRNCYIIIVEKGSNAGGDARLLTIETATL